MKLAGLPVVVTPKMPKGVAVVVGPSKDGPVVLARIVNL